MDGTGIPRIGINTYNEKALHAALKLWYASPDDRMEVPLDGYIIDLIHEGTLIEIQTGSFSAIRRKLYDLSDRYPVRLVFPIALEKWIVNLPETDADSLHRRKSPKRGRVEELFRELVYMPSILAKENFTIEVLLIHEEEVRRFQAKRRWRRKGWVTAERRLLKVVERCVFASLRDLGALVPDMLVEPFTTRELAKATRQPVWLAQKMTYCLREAGVITQSGKRGRAYEYIRNPAYFL